MWRRFRILFSISSLNDENGNPKRQKNGHKDNPQHGEDQRGTSDAIKTQNTAIKKRYPCRSEMVAVQTCETGCFAYTEITIETICGKPLITHSIRTPNRKSDSPRRSRHQIPPIPSSTTVDSPIDTLRNFMAFSSSRGLRCATSPALFLAILRLRLCFLIRRIEVGVLAHDALDFLSLLLIV